MKVVPSKKQFNTSLQTVERKNRTERRVKFPLSPDRIKRLLKASAEGRQKRVITIMLETGMHPSVLDDPEKYDMESFRGMLTWKRPKTYALCVWEYDGDLKPLVEQFLESDLGLDRTTYYNDVVDAATKANLKYVSPLTLRHTAIVELLKKHAPDLDAVKRIVQCSDRTLWRYYARLRGYERRDDE